MTKIKVSIIFSYSSLKKNKKDLVNFWHRKMTLKVRIVLVLTFSFNSKMTEIQKNVFMAVFVVLWPYLLTTKLSFLKKNNFGHTMHGLLIHIFGAVISNVNKHLKRYRNFLGICSLLGKKIYINLLYPRFWNSTTNIAITSFQEKIPEKLDESEQHIFP